MNIENNMNLFERYYEKRSNTKKVYRGLISIKHQTVFLNDELEIEASRCFALYRPISKSKYMEKRKWEDFIHQRKVENFL